MKILIDIAHPAHVHFFKNFIRIMECLYSGLNYIYIQVADILTFQYSEKMKSGLLIGIGILDQLMFLRGEELSGGKKVLIWYLEGLLREVRIAENVFGWGHYVDLERKLMEVIGRIQMSQFQEAQRSLPEAISLATTSCQTAMNFLVEKKLV
jgi:hypothetical protein